VLATINFTSPVSKYAICIWGNVKYWDDPEIKATNPKLNLPHIPITPVHRADGSGTTWIFTNYLTKVCPAWAQKVGFNTSVAWPVGVGGKGNEGVTNYVMRIRGGIGYIEYAYYKQNQNRLKAAVLETKLLVGRSNYANYVSCC